MTSARSTMLGYIAGSGTSTPSIRRSASVRHLMVSKVRGRFTKFEGELVTGADPLESSVTVSIDPNSIATGDENRDAHLRSADPRRGELPGDDMAVDARAPSLQHPA